MGIIKTLKQGPLVASGPLFLLLLATVTMKLQRTGASTSSSDVCEAETTACENDEECYQCYFELRQEDVSLYNYEALIDCTDNRDEYYYFDLEEPCSSVEYLRVQPCCYNSLSANDCLENSAFVDYWVCHINDRSERVAQVEECAITSLTCEAVVVDDTDEADDDASVIGDDGSVADDDAWGIVGDDARTTVGGTTSSAVCVAEHTACSNDEECYECITDWYQGDDPADALVECIGNNDLGDMVDPCSYVTPTACCYDSLSANDCLGNNAFVEFWVCAGNNLSQEECTTTSFTCSGGSEDGLVVDGTDEADDDASVIGGDAPVADDDAGGVVGDDAAGDDAGIAVDDDVASSDRGVVVADDDAPVADDDAGEVVGDDAGAAVGGTTSSQSTFIDEGDSSDVVASPFPSVTLTAFLGLAFVTAAPFLAVWL